MSEREEGFRFPPCWKDDMRMNSLFAPFRAASINPTDWHSKMKFWDSLIEQWCFYHKAPLIELPILTNHFRRNNEVPSCLPEVVKHLTKNKTIVSKDGFYQMTEPSWKNWAVQIMVVNPLQWTLGRVKNAITGNNGISDNILVHLPTVKKLGQELVEKVPEDCKGKLLDISSVEDISNIKNIEVLELILRWLGSQKLLALHQDNSNVLIKFPKKEDTNLTITEIDKAFYSLEQNKKILENNLNKLEQQRENLLEEARRNVAAKKMIMAKKCLRRKKVVENLLQKIGCGLENIEKLIYEMQMAQMVNVILDCYQTGVTSLNKYYKENGLTKDRVIDAKNEVEQVLICAADIDNAISESVSNPITDESNEELEKELENLLTEVTDESTERKSDSTDGTSILESLPDVPSVSPDISVDEKLEKRLAGLAL